MTNSTDTEERTPLAPGSRLGAYEITRFLARGGMAEVYVARDTRLRRNVAVKILPAVFGKDRDRLRRFEQEIRATSRLNHPNIVSIHDVGDIGEIPYFVTELLEGETLRSRLDRGPIPLSDAINYAMQIGRGLAAAHEQGIVHRDLKPANVFLMRGDHLKILDFGLAKIAHRDRDQAGAEEETFSATQGRVLGSVGYMAPEQVEGAESDVRTDIFAFGAMLYEMISGRRAFHSDSPVETMHAILRLEPADLVEAPPALARVVMRCLAKRPADRFQSVDDLLFSMRETITAPMTRALAPGRFRAAAAAILHPVTDGERRWRGIGMASVVLLTAALVTAYTLSSRGTGGSKSQGPERREIQLERLTASGHVGVGASLSPDAHYVAYAGEEGGKPALWLLHVATGSRTRIVDGATTQVRFSPDGNYVYFCRGEEQVDVYRVPMLGGEPQMVARNIDWGTGVTFARDGGRIAFLRTDPVRHTSDLVGASASGGSEWKIASRPERGAFLDCTWSPDSVRFLCEVSTGPGSVEMVDVNAANGAQRVLRHFMNLGRPEWLPDGSGVVGEAAGGPTQQLWRVSWPDGKPEKITNDLSNYVRPTVAADGSSMAAIRIDTATNLWSMPVDEPAQVRPITTGINTQDGNFGVVGVPDGRIVWASGVSGKSIDLWIADGDGENRRRMTFDDDSDEVWPDVSPDGTSAVYARQVNEGPNRAPSDIWLIKIGDSIPRRLTSSGDAALPRFTADGSEVIFVRRINGEPYLFAVSIAGGAIRQVSDKPAAAPSLSSDGKWLLVGITEKGRPHIELWPLTGSGEKKAFPFFGLKRWTRDNRAFAYVKLEGKSSNVWLQPIDGGPQRQLTFLPAGEIVAFGFDFSRDGKQLIFAHRSQIRDVVLLKNLK